MKKKVKSHKSQVTSRRQKTKKEQIRKRLDYPNRSDNDNTCSLFKPLNLEPLNPEPLIRPKCKLQVGYAEGVANLILCFHHSNAPLLHYSNFRNSFRIFEM